jgi:hypothetical protein
MMEFAWGPTYEVTPKSNETIAYPIGKVINIKMKV